MKFVKLLSFLSCLSLMSCTMSDFSESEPNIESDTYSEEQQLSSLPPASYDDNGFALLPSGYFPTYKKEEGKKSSRVYAPSYDSSLLFNEYKSYINGVEVDLFKVKTDTSHRFSPSDYQREDSALLNINAEGKIRITIALNHKLLTKPTIRPLQSSLPYTINEEYRTIEFTVFNKGQYTLEFNDYRTKTLHLFVNDFDDSYKQYENDNSTYYFKAGLHNKANDSCIPSNGIINLTSGKKRVVIEPGAVVQAGFFATGLSDIEILGTGIIDGSVFDRNATTGTRLIPVDFQYCDKTKIIGVSFTDCAGWCLSMYYQSNLTIDNVKIITSRANGDGISLQSCTDTVVTNCFIRSFDDSLVVKNYPKYGNMSSEGSTRNIRFYNCLIFNDLAQCMEVGYETIGSLMRDIEFDNITVLHAYHHAVVSLHNANNANVENVTYKNITVEDAAMGRGDGNSRLIDISVAYSSTWSDNWKKTNLGTIDTVNVTNMKVSGKNDGRVIVVGSLDTRDNSTHYTNNVTISDVEINGNILEEDSSVILKNEYVKGLQFKDTENETTGSTIPYEYTREEADLAYSDFVEFGL